MANPPRVRSPPRLAGAIAERVFEGRSGPRERSAEARGTIKGGILCSQDGQRVQFAKKSRLRLRGQGRTTLLIRAVTMKIPFFCRKCRRAARPSVGTSDHAIACAPRLPEKPGRALAIVVLESPLGAVRRAACAHARRRAGSGSEARHQARWTWSCGSSTTKPSCNGCISSLARCTRRAHRQIAGLASSTTKRTGIVERGMRRNPPRRTPCEYRGTGRRSGYAAPPRAAASRSNAASDRAAHEQPECRRGVRYSGRGMRTATRAAAPTTLKGYSLHEQPDDVSGDRPIAPPS